jgi:hypothetical protein
VIWLSVDNFSCADCTLVGPYSISASNIRHLPETRIAEQFSQVRGDRLELLDAAILCKRRERVASARAHASLQEGEYVDEADPLSSFAIQIRQFDLHEFQFSSFVSLAGMFPSPNPPTL